MGLSPTKRTFGPNVDRRYLVTDRRLDEGLGCTLDKATFTRGANGVTAEGIIPAGYPIVVNAAGIGSRWSTGALSGITINAVDLNKDDGLVSYQTGGDVDPSLTPVDFSAATGHGFIFRKA